METGYCARRLSIEDNGRLRKNPSAPGEKETPPTKSRSIGHVEELIGMPRKKVDNRIRALIENGVSLRQRSMFVVVGDKSRDQVKIDGFLL